MPKIDMPTHSGLPNHTQSPPGGWRCRMPETGQEFHGHSEYQVIAQLRASYKANGYPEPADYKAMIEAYVCSKTPEYCTGNHPVDVPMEGFTFHTVLQGMRTLTKWLWQSGLKGARQYVPQPQADVRASVCVSCSYNDDPQGCTSCNSRTMREALKIVVGERHTQFDARLRSCRVCQCQLQAKVHLPHAVLWDNMLDEQRTKLPVHCWLVTEEVALAAANAAASTVITA